jgi:hypothetical protein
MTSTAHEVLAGFDALSLADRRKVMAEILRRSAATDALSDAAFDELAAELFRGYDAEEAARAKP